MLRWLFQASCLFLDNCKVSTVWNLMLLLLHRETLCALGVLRTSPRPGQWWGVLPRWWRKPAVCCLDCSCSAENQGAVVPEVDPLYISWLSSALGSTELWVIIWHQRAGDWSFVCYSSAELSPQSWNPRTVCFVAIWGCPEQWTSLSPLHAQGSAPNLKKVLRETPKKLHLLGMLNVRWKRNSLNQSH